MCQQWFLDGSYDTTSNISIHTSTRGTGFHCTVTVTHLCKDRKCDNIVPSKSSNFLVGACPGPSS